VPSKGGFKKRPLKLAGKLKTVREDMLWIGTQMATAMRERIFPDSGAGRDEDAKPFKPYSTKRLYVAKKARSKGGSRADDMPAPKGGRKPPRIKKAKDAKTVRFDDGYSGYRKGVGRSSGGDVNLQLTGQTRRAFNVTHATDDAVTLGFRTRKQRARALDAKYRFLDLTHAELQRWRRMTKDLILRKLKKGSS
jgi:hypothetical protein